MSINPKQWQLKYNKLKIQNNPFEYDFKDKIFVDSKIDKSVRDTIDAIVNDVLTIKKFINRQSIYDTDLFKIDNLEDEPNMDPTEHYIAYNHISTTKGVMEINSLIKISNIYLDIAEYSKYLKTSVIKTIDKFYNSEISNALFKLLVSLDSNNSLVNYVILTGLNKNFDFYKDVYNYDFIYNKANNEFINFDKTILHTSIILRPFVYVMTSKDCLCKVYFRKFLLMLIELLYHINKLDDVSKSTICTYCKDFNSMFISDILELKFNDSSFKIDKNIEEIFKIDDIKERFYAIKKLNKTKYYNAFDEFVDLNNGTFRISKQMPLVLDQLFSFMDTKFISFFYMHLVNRFKNILKTNNIHESFNFVDSEEIVDLEYSCKSTLNLHNNHNANNLIGDNNTSKVFITTDFESKIDYEYSIYNNSSIEADTKTISKYNIYASKIRFLNKTLIKEIKNIKTYNQNFKNSGKNNGKLDMKNIYHYKTNKNIFYDNTYKTREQDLVFGILLDCSGSMSGDGIENGKISMIVLDETLKALNVNHCIYGHDSNGKHQTNIYKYSYFKGDKNYTLSKNYSLADVCARYGNCDSGALAYVEKELLEQPNKDKICLIFSDGEPTECSSKELIAQVKHMEKNGIKVIGIGINFESIREFYKDYANGKNLNEMFNIISNILKEYVLEKINK